MLIVVTVEAMSAAQSSPPPPPPEPEPKREYLYFQVVLCYYNTHTCFGKLLKMVMSDSKKT